jgi:flagellar biosynthesis/type III secretory pathway chaperone
VEELVTILHDEEQLYCRLLEYGEQKRQILIDADVPALEKLTSLEQTTSDELLSLSNRQIQTLKDIATVLGKTEGKMTVTRLIECLAGQPDIQAKLQEAKDRLLDAAGKMQAVNQQNEALLKQAIELVEFDITLFKSMRQAPETANYDKNAYNTGTLLGSSGFDAKQ